MKINFSIKHIKIQSAGRIVKYHAVVFESIIINCIIFSLIPKHHQRASASDDGIPYKRSSRIFVEVTENVEQFFHVFISA